MYLNKVAFSEMIWRKTINLLPDLVQCKIKRGHCVSAKNQKCWKNESTWVSQKRSCVKNTLVSLFNISKMHGTEVNCRQAAKKSSKLKRVWQAQFLSYTLATLRKIVFFKDVQLILVSFFDIFNNSLTITSVCST